MSEQTSYHVHRAIDGDSQSFAWLAQRFRPFVEAQVKLRVGPTVGEQDREDLVADIWVTVLRRVGDLRPRDGRYAPVLVRFLGTTVLNRCNRFLRDRIRRRRRTGADAGDPDEFAAVTRGIVTRIGNDELVARIRASLESLGPEKRQVLVLRLLEQRSNREIAGMLGIPANTVAVRYRRALEELRRGLPPDVYREVRATRGRGPTAS